MNDQYKKPDSVARLANGTKLHRFIHSPINYCYGIIFAKLIYPLTKRKSARTASLFFGGTMKVLLPSATDIYLTGGKTDDSEVRLAAFLLRHLKNEDQFLDIGAHYGYYSLLAAASISNKNNIIACEPAKESFGILETNATDHFCALSMAISDSKEPVTFYEFPNRFAEYNTMYPEQFNRQPWISHYPPVARQVNCTTIDALTAGYNFQPAIIKIDTEGAEHKVINGALNYLQQHNCMVAMEYLSAGRGNEHHKKAAALLATINYHPHCIETDGSLTAISNIDTLLAEKKRDADNIVFKMV